MDKWNPIDKFWSIFYPLFNPKPDASPSRLSMPAPIWDLPSPFGKVKHPTNSDSVPHFVNPGYYEKLSMIPEYEVVHPDPPAWMITANLGLNDWLFRIPVIGATGPAVSYAVFVSKKMKPSMYSMVSTALIGLATGFAVAYSESESRLQGYLENTSDVAHWKKRVEHDRLVLEGKINPLDEMSAVQKSVNAVFGPKKYDLESIEKEYYESK